MKIHTLVLLLALFVGCAPEYEIGHPTSNPTTPENPAASYDILVMLDTSCSMNDNAYIDYGITQIPNTMNADAISWQMAMTTMTPSDHLWVDVNTAAADPGWSILTDLSRLRYSQGFAEEAGVDSAIRFRDENHEWFRPGATTLMLFLSDEEEQSITDPSELNDWPNKLYITSMVGVHENDCADQAPIYWGLSDAVLDICKQEPWTIMAP